MKNILIVVGTRPNYIKVTQFKKVAELKFKHFFNIKIVHTGQHFDKAMADVFFKQLDIWPDFFLNIPQASPNTQMGEIMLRMEQLIENDFKPDLILVPGDVNSTLAAALTANKLNIPLGHLESGLRSFDRSMPEEINRILVDEITDHFFVTEQSGIDNLLAENKPPEKIHYVGNTMIDTLVAFDKEIKFQTLLNQFNIEPNAFVLITIHRPATVDHYAGLERLIKLLMAVSQYQKVVFPMHPRTLKNIQKFGLKKAIDNIKDLIILEPLDYFNFQHLIYHCSMVITDSGGIQEETTYKQKPCLTLRPNTERPSTIEIGSNTLLNFDEQSILNHVNAILRGNYKKGQIPKYWEGKATERILNILKNV